METFALRFVRPVTTASGKVVAGVVDVVAAGVEVAGDGGADEPAGVVVPVAVPVAVPVLGAGLPVVHAAASNTHTPIDA
jgi:hypothetical protein